MWNPSRIGTWTVGVSDQGFSATIQVEVRQGLIEGVSIILSEEIIRSGDSIVASLSAYDSAGNQRVINGDWTIADELEAENHESWMVLNPGPIGIHSLSSMWFDNETGTVHSIQDDITVQHGVLARIILPATGTKVPSDGVLDLNPIFEDEYGNILSSVYVNWEIDGEERTMEIRIAQGIVNCILLG